MNEEKNVLKIKGYDKFRCIADRCKFTCCSGWDINVDIDTYDKWKEKDNLNYLLDNIRFKKEDGKKNYLIKKETKEDCPFLDSKGLCKVVKDHGDEYLSLTCQSFPRIENDFDMVKELSLSCSCPEVVNIISESNEKISIEVKDDLIYVEEIGSLKIRETLVYILQREKGSLEEKLLTSFEMLNYILSTEDMDYEELIEYLDNKKKEVSLNRYIEKYKNENKAIKEFNNIFLDMIENYKEVEVMSNTLNYLYNKSREIIVKPFMINDVEKYYLNFYKDFKNYNNLIKNCIVAKVFSDCVSEDIYELVISFEMIILEYLLIRHGGFLKYLKGNLNNEDIKDYIVVFSRIIGNNKEALLDYLFDRFDEEIIAVDYLKSLIF